MKRILLIAAACALALAACSPAPIAPVKAVVYHGFQPGEVDRIDAVRIDTAKAAAVEYCRNTYHALPATKWQASAETTFDGTNAERNAKLLVACLGSMRIAPNGQVTVRY